MKPAAVSRAALGIGVLAATTLLAACGGPGAADGRPQVVASFYPLAYVAERVAGKHADVQQLTSPGAEPHDIELTIRQTAEVSGADLVVLSRGFQPAVDAAVDQNAEGEVVDAASAAELIPLTDDATAHAKEWDTWRAAHPDAPLDPHFWLDPTRLRSVADRVEKRLAELDPAHAKAYAANLADLEADLTTLDRDIASGLHDCERDTVVVSHNAFGYFGLRYGLHMRALSGLSPDSEPSPAHLRELATLVEEKGITTVFSETLASPQMADTLAGDLGLRTAVLDPIEGLTAATADEDYLSLMRANLAALEKANGCS